MFNHNNDTVYIQYLFKKIGGIIIIIMIQCMYVYIYMPDIHGYNPVAQIFG